MKKGLQFLLLLLIASSVHGQSGVQKVLIEEFTGAWCGYCPDGALKIDQILTTYSGYVTAVAIHEGDDMQNNLGTAIINQYQVGSYPSGMVNRKTFPSQSSPVMSRTLWQNSTYQELLNLADMEVYVSTSYDSTTGICDISASCTAFNDIIGDMRLHVFISEDKVTGTGSGYNQSNYYSAASSAAGGPSHYYYNFPNPIVGFEHMHVLRSSVTGNWGDVSVIPDTVLNTQTFSKTYTYTVPSTSDATNMHVVAFVTKMSGGDTLILNSETAPFLTPSTGFQDVASSFIDLRLYPNPSVYKTIVSGKLATEGLVSIKVQDLTGKTVQTVCNDTFAAGTFSQEINTTELNAGMYLVVLEQNGSRQTARLVIQ